MCNKFGYFITLFFCTFLLASYPMVTGSFPVVTVPSCDSPANPIQAENCLPGNPASEWGIGNEVDDPSIRGFATDISVNRGETVSFKIKTDAVSYQLDIYRMGYYGGMGARKVATVTPSAALPQLQPTCLTDATTGLVDCGNWALSASWAVPADATSGIYFARLDRTDTGGASHIVFVVRDDAGTSDLLFQTSDTTWQAYNSYGGKSLYDDLPTNRAFKVSYNRPFDTRATSSPSYFFNAEYPMVRWLEANGYDVNYFSGVDADRRGNLLLNHKIFLSVGHDEYWSGEQRTRVEAARNAGVHLAFFSGNEVFWKTRWENSIDGAATPHRTLVCYKETVANAIIDPHDPPIWTGTWRDPRFSPPSDGGRPENALTGTIFTINASLDESIKVPYEDGQMRFWRDTSVASLAPGAVAILSSGTLGYEADEDLDNGFRPAGLFRLSTTTVNNVSLIQDYGSTYVPGTATHHLTLYRHSSGALVFGSGTVQWAWGLDGNHDRGISVPDESMQQATVNLFADMGVQPATLQWALTPATASTDTVAPTSTIILPVSGSPAPNSGSVSVSGTATDTGGVVGGVEVSVDGGATWHPANGRATWNFTGTVVSSVPGSVTILSRAVDDSGNIETPGAGINITVGTRICPCSLWNSSATPVTSAVAQALPLELGVKFKTDVDGFITGIRFYKGGGNTGTHLGTLWSSSGAQLATATFTNETASGWQQVDFATPVAITANTVYVASYYAPNGHFAVDRNYFATAGVDNPPVHLLRDGVSGGNGVNAYSDSAPAFPTSTFQSSNYWVDVVFVAPDTPPIDTLSPTVTAMSPGANAADVNPETTVSATFSEAIDPATLTPSTFGLQGVTDATVTYNPTTRTATLNPGSPLAAATNYTATVKGGAAGVKDLAGNALSADISWSFTTESTFAYSVWNSSATPATPAVTQALPIELGVKFKTDVDGFITGIRFYKGDGNTGTHLGTLWSGSGAQLATATFTNETASGWQQVDFATPVAITANTIYVASYYAPNGHFAVDRNYFATAGVNNPPVHLLVDGESGGNGVNTYSDSAPAFPTSTFQSSNYWVDVVFVVPDTTPPAMTAMLPVAGTTDVNPGTAVTATFSEAIEPATLTPSTFGLQGVSDATVTYNPTTRTATLSPGSPLATATTYTATVKGGAAGVKDLAGNALSADIAGSFTTASTFAYSVWNSSATPATPAVTQALPLELGVKFKTDMDGFITGIRFYKGDGNTGTHLGTLWSSSGAQLATATFTNETASGWQQVDFATPVAITANTIYVASYYAPNGHFAVDRNYFATAGVNNPPVHLLVDGESGGNGVNTYSNSAPAFPTSTYQSSNYWVDVVFTPTPPVIAVSPAGLSFTMQNGQNPSTQTLALSNTGGGELNWSAATDSTAPAWLSVSPGTGVGNASTLTIEVDGLSLAPGVYQKDITITAVGANTSRIVPVSLTVVAPPVIAVSPASLSFTFENGLNPPAQTLALSNTGGGGMNWSAAADSAAPAWLSVSPGTGVGNASALTVAVDGQGLAPGVYQKNITVTAEGADVSRIVPVSLSVCSYGLDKTSKSFTKSGGTGSIKVTPSTSTCRWTAVSNAAWITVTSGSSGTGTATVAYKVSTNGTNQSRTGTITVAGKTFTVTQAK